MGLETLADNGIAGVAIGLIIVLVFVIREFFKYLNKTDKRHLEAYKKVTKSVDSNTKSTNAGVKLSKEMFTYMKLRNGSLEKTLDKLERRK